MKRKTEGRCRKVRTQTRTRDARAVEEAMTAGWGEAARESGRTREVPQSSRSEEGVRNGNMGAEQDCITSHFELEFPAHAKSCFPISQAS